MTRNIAVLSIAALVVAFGACNYEQETGEQVEYTQAETDLERTEEAADEMAEARELVEEAVAVVDEMQADPALEPLLAEAKGLLIVPDYGRGGLVVGARGGEAVLVSRSGDEWNGPVFYDIGAISLGVQAGGEGGEIAMLLMSDEAVNSFAADDEFALNAEAGLTVVDYSTYAQATAGVGDEDVILWSDTEGLFAGATLSISGISFDDEENAAYYGRSVAAGEILDGAVTAPESQGFLDQLPS